LHRSLEAARLLVEQGQRQAGKIRSAMENLISTFPLVNLEYISICDNIFLRPLEELSGEVLVAVAARIGRARLIDNMVLKIE